jgi:hypothetical protein
MLRAGGDGLADGLVEVGVIHGPAVIERARCELEVAIPIVRSGAERTPPRSDRQGSNL